MSKIYTAQAMREEAKSLKDSGLCLKISDMLLQAADAMEREKKYEYSYMFLDGTVASAHRESPRMVFGDNVHGRTVVRRSVGEWEVVKYED